MPTHTNDRILLNRIVMRTLSQGVRYIIVSDRVRVNGFDGESSRDDSKVMSTLNTKLKIMLVHLEMRGILAPKNVKKRTSDRYHSILRDAGRKCKFADFI